MLLARPKLLCCPPTPDTLLARKGSAFTHTTRVCLRGERTRAESTTTATSSEPAPPLEADTGTATSTVATAGGREAQTARQGMTATATATAVATFALVEAALIGDRARQGDRVGTARTEVLARSAASHWRRSASNVASCFRSRSHFHATNSNLDAVRQ